MRFSKPPLTVSQQADLLIKRGLNSNRDILIRRLNEVSYYRLSGYWLSLKQDEDKFKKDANFDTVWNRYVFDRQLRLLIIDAVERIEISVKTHLINNFALKYGAFGHLKAVNFRTEFLNENRYGNFLKSLRENAGKNNSDFIKHYKNCYNEFPDLPIWVAGEIMTFGALFTMYNNLHRNEQIDLAKVYGISGSVLKSWLKTINYTRNVCAHHGRLWDIQLSINPIIPKRESSWRVPVNIQNSRVFGILTVLKYMLKLVAPQSKWALRLETLFDSYPDIPISKMGFPLNWKESEIWKA